MNTSQGGSIMDKHRNEIIQGEQYLQEVMKRSAVDMQYRQKLLENPKEALYEVTGVQIPETVSVAFVEKQGDATIVLPPFYDGDAELSEEELEAVAGGATPIILSIIASIESIIASIGGIVND